MRAHIQFKYILNQNHHETLSFKFENPIVDQIAQNIDEVASLIDQAEYYQTLGYYVVLTLPYESAKAFNKAFDVHEDVENFGSLQVYKEPVTDFSEDTSHNQVVKWNSIDSDETLSQNIKDIQYEITNGNTYQVNYTTRLKAKSIDNPYEYYRFLTYESNGNYVAYIENSEENIISISPELFFQTGPHETLEHCILTKPMKGTIERGSTLQEDDDHYQWLANSSKDKAENVMIVDLLRNDLTKISKPGTVETVNLFMIEAYKTVFQMTSTVRSEMQKNLRLYNILEALFPCGSITGAPKEATMKVIQRLEKTPRKIYCGTIGLLLPDGRKVFSVPIRTVLNTKKEAVYGVGAGITIDSRADDEIKEFKMKTKILEHSEQSLIETMRIEDGLVKRREVHTERVIKGAEALNIDLNIAHWHKHLDDATRECCSGTFKLRIEINHSGVFKVNIQELADNNKPLTAKLMLSTNAPYIYRTNKTTARRQFDHNHETDVVLFYDNHNELTEFDIGNLVLKYENEYITPIYKGQFLNGCMRQSLLDNGVIKERKINKSDLFNKDIEVYMINSLREWTKIDLKF